MTFHGQPVLVTGGAGFIGSRLVHRLLALEASVTVVDAMLPDSGANPFNLAEVGDRIRFHTLDLRETGALMPLLEGQDYVFHLAGQVSHADGQKDPLHDLALNAQATLSLLEACRLACPASRIVHAATRQQYGRAQYLPMDESHPQMPVDLNGIHKMAAEQHLHHYHATYGLRGTSLRLTNTYGPHQRIRDNRHGFVPWFIRLALESKPLPVFGDGRQLRDFTYVEDVVEALLLAADSDATAGQAYNLGGERPYSLLDLVETLFQACGGGERVLVPFPPEQKAIDVGDAYCDFRRFTEATGWIPKTSLPEGLRLSIDFYRRHWEHYR